MCGALARWNQPLLDLKPQYSLLLPCMCPSIYSSGNLFQVWSSRRSEPSGQRILGQERVPQNTQAQGSSRLVVFVFNSIAFFRLGNIDVEVSDDLVCYLASVRRAKRGEGFDLLRYEQETMLAMGNVLHWASF